MRAALTILTLAALACSSGTDNSNNNQVPPHNVDIRKNAAILGSSAFSPLNETISLAATSTVKWYNADITGSGGSYGSVSGVTHKLVSDDGTTFASGNIPPGGIFTATISATGTFTYHCAIHTTMTGTLTVNP
jgi:plastocyanin